MAEQSISKSRDELGFTSDPKLGRITQGTIFQGGIAEGYNDAPVWGIVITAKCDTAHQKASIINYLPLVRVEDWIIKNGAELLLLRLIKEKNNDLKNFLKSKKLSESLLDVHDYSVISEIYFKYPTESKTQQGKAQAKDADKIRNIVDDINKAKDAVANFDNAKFSQILLKNENLLKTLLIDLISNTLNGYYYIIDIGDLTDFPSKIGYVVLMREVRHIPQNIALDLPAGISKFKHIDHIYGGLSFDVFDFIYPIAEIRSPWIEHLMQAFCGLFGRIGVIDIKKTIAESILNTIIESRTVNTKEVDNATL